MRRVFPKTVMTAYHAMPMLVCLCSPSMHGVDSSLGQTPANYRQKGPWYDWSMFRWAKEGTGSQNRSKEDSCVHYGDENTNEEDFTYAPGQILGFLKICDHASPEKVTTQVIVLCCDSSYSKSSVFTTHWKVLYEDKAFTKPMIRLVSPDSIVRHCLMIPENDDWNGYHEVWTRERWAAEFCAV